MLLRLTGPALGESSPDGYGPDGWFDYPVGVEHQTRSPGGCLLLFVHERVADA